MVANTQFLILLFLALAFIALSGCAPVSSNTSGQLIDDIVLPVDFEFVGVYENEKNAPYFPINSISSVCYANDGTLYFSDEVRGLVHGLSPRHGRWFTFDTPGAFFRPVDLQVDGLWMLVLDYENRMLFRFNKSGVYHDRLINFPYLDPGYNREPFAFDMDVDGRVVVCDYSEQQVLMLDSYLELNQFIGGSGPNSEQFYQPSGIAYRPDGGFVVTDMGNSRIHSYNRMGYFEGDSGGFYDINNPMRTPQGIDCDSVGNIFIADPAASAIHVYSRTMNHLFSAGPEMGILAAPMEPVDVAIGPDDLIAVADKGRRAVILFRIIYR
jgi:sugar lactone lactonase YvrE